MCRTLFACVARRLFLVGSLGLLVACRSDHNLTSTLYYVNQDQSAIWPPDGSTESVGPPGAHLSPDGTRWVDGSFYELTLHDEQTGESHLMAGAEAGSQIIPESVVWAPDGRRLAYWQFEVTGYAVRVVSLDGFAGTTVELAAGRAGGKLAWLDPSKLVYSDLDLLYLYDLDTGEASAFGEGRQPTASPDGSRVAFERVSDVAPNGCATAVGAGVVNADGGGWRMVLDEANRFASVVGWGESGEALIVLSRFIDCNAPEPPAPDRLLRIDVESGGVETLSSRENGPWPIVLIAADPFSDRVAFVEPACDPAGEAVIAQSLVVSSIGRPDIRETVAELEAPGCAFSRLRWLPPPVARPEATIWIID